MKNALSVLIISLMLPCSHALANKIDDLKTDKDVEDFIVSQDTAWLKRTDTPPLKVADWSDVKNCYAQSPIPNVKKWQKLDLNGDGRTDLLAMAQWGRLYAPYLVLDKGDGSYRLISLYYGMGDDCEPAAVIEQQHKTMLVRAAYKAYWQHIANGTMPIGAIVIDTLIYKFGGLIEYNAKPIIKPISQVTFHSGACYGACPVFTISFNAASGKATCTKFLMGYTREKEVTGNYTGTISSVAKKELLTLMNYIDFTKVENDYQVGSTDQSTATLSIKFKDGTEKQISDYGERGTYGLQQLYALFFKMEKEQDWHDEQK